MKFSDHLWQAITPIYQQILHHPFNIELAKGTLDENRFLFYLKQDAYYLIHFSKALALIAARSETTRAIHHFLQFSFDALVAERKLHASFLAPDDNGDRIDPSPSCIAYTQYLIATAATATIEEAIAAVLPCFWIYQEVGNTLAAHCSKDNPYIRWIQTYSGQEFATSTTQAIVLLNEQAQNSSKHLLERMKRAFEYSALFEWHFWDHAYKMLHFENSIPKTCGIISP